ncbi:MAG: peptidylprolyl isomerase [Prochlorotrichaceae cyanobacterium]
MTTIFRWLGTSVGLLACLGILAACSSQAVDTPTADTGAPAETAETAAAPATPEAIAQTDPTAQNNYENLPRLKGEAIVEMLVNGQVVTMTLMGEDAPITAGNFVDLVSQQFYDGLPFHRVVRDPQPFVVQGGDPQGRDPNFPAARLGTGGYVDPATGAERNIPLEILPADAETILYGQTFKMANLSNAVPKLNHIRGAVAMARSQFPNSASSQFYIALADLSFLDGDYAVFGYVTEGMEVVDQIQQGDRIESITVISGLENLEKPNSETSE